jgi:hypothetical protein
VRRRQDSTREEQRALKTHFQNVLMAKLGQEDRPAVTHGKRKQNSSCVPRDRKRLEREEVRWNEQTVIKII